jgi:hypothetical protein
MILEAIGVVVVFYVLPFVAMCLLLAAIERMSQ